MIEEFTLPIQRKVRIEHTATKHDYWIESSLAEDGWHKVPSVTSILDVYHKPALSWWGMTIGVAGMFKLIEDGYWNTQDYTFRQSPEEVVKLLTEHKLTVNHVKGQAADRGTDVHKAAEDYVLGKPIEATTPYHEALGAFFSECNPQFKQTEVVCASWGFGFAGKFDALAYIGDDLWLLDYKTSKRVYETHYAQLAFYKAAGWESGYWDNNEDRTLRQGIVHLAPTGKFKLVENTHYTTLNVQEAIAGYHAYKAMKPPKREKK